MSMIRLLFVFPVLCVVHSSARVLIGAQRAALWGAHDCCTPTQCRQISNCSAIAWKSRRRSSNAWPSGK